MTKDFKVWKGPSDVLRKDGQTVLKKYDGSLYYIYPSQLIKTEDYREEKTYVKQKEPVMIKTRVKILIKVDVVSYQTLEN